MTEGAPDFSAHAPQPPPPWKVSLVRAAARFSPYRVPWVRRRVLALWRSRRRARRLAAEARGDFSLSRPALYGMADRLEPYLGFDGGFFVEAGVNDGYDQSNTYHLERQRDWRGLLVEAVPALHELAVVERPNARVVNCALVDSGHPGGHVDVRYGGLRSVVAGAHGSEDKDHAWVEPAFALGLEETYEVTVPARTLSELLDEIDAPEVDFLSLDVEGYEPQVLRGLDLARHAPRFILVEVVDEAARLLVEAELEERYVLLEQLSPFDVLYARRDQAEARTRS
jgi:FkbM family methyltransferase